MTDLTSIFDISKQIAESVQDAYMQEYGPDSRLSNFTWNVDWDGNIYRLKFNLPKEWYWVEHGRMPSAKMPPVDAIVKWIQVQKLVPQSKNGKVPSTKSMAFAIAKKIQKEGFYSPGHQGKHILSKTLFNDNRSLVKELCNAIASVLNKEVNSDLVHLFDDMKNFK